jgi:hypothetical protein
MDGGGTGVQGLSHLRIGPAATAFTDISFEQDPRMEQLHRCGPPGAHESQQLFTFLCVEPDNLLDHQHSPL